EEALARLSTLLDIYLSAADALRAANGTPDEARAIEDVKRAEASLRAWEDRLVAQKITVDQLHVTATCLGDILDEGFDPDAQLARGVTLTGGFEDAEILKPEAPGLAAESVKLGAVQGTVVYSTDAIEVRDFRLSALTVDAPAYYGGGRAVWSSKAV